MNDGPDENNVVVVVDCGGCTRGLAIMRCRAPQYPFFASPNVVSLAQYKLRDRLPVLRLVSAASTYKCSIFPRHAPRCVEPRQYGSILNSSIMR